MYMASRDDLSTQKAPPQVFVDGDKDRHVEWNSNETRQKAFEQAAGTLFSH